MPLHLFPIWKDRGRVDASRLGTNFAEHKTLTMRLGRRFDCREPMAIFQTRFGLAAIVHPISLACRATTRHPVGHSEITHLSSSSVTSLKVICVNFSTSFATADRETWQLSNITNLNSPRSRSSLRTSQPKPISIPDGNIASQRIVPSETLPLRSGPP